jgi:uncharacterized protein
MPRRAVQRIQDSVHGLMEFHGTETSVVEALRVPEVQRLRRITQLGMCDVVFPGAEHSRFAHSIGAAHVALRMCRQLAAVAPDVVVLELRPDEEIVRDVALAALTHDIGHGPLSHVWEREVVRQFDRERWCEVLGLDPKEPGFVGTSWHELITQGLLACPDTALHRVLEIQEAGTAERVRKLLLKQYPLRYLSRMLSGDVDCDRCDFLLRDALHTGVAYGRYDIDWLISTMTLGFTYANQLVVGFDARKAPRVLEQFFVARRALYDTVYNHKTVRIAESMVGLVLRRLRDLVRQDKWFNDAPQKLDPFRKILGGEPLAPVEILQLDDHGLNELIDLGARSTIDGTVADLAGRIVARDLFKQFPISPERLAGFNTRDALLQLQEVVAPHVPGRASLAQYYVCIDYSPFKMLSQQFASEAYLVQADTEERLASPVRDHPQIRGLFAITQEFETPRLFAPAEAHDALRQFFARTG